MVSRPDGPVDTDKGECVIIKYYIDDEGMINAYLPGNKIHGAVWLCCAKTTELLKAALARHGLLRGRTIELKQDQPSS